MTYTSIITYDLIKALSMNKKSEQTAKTQNIHYYYLNVQVIVKSQVQKVDFEPSLKSMKCLCYILFSQIRTC